MQIIFQLIFWFFPIAPLTAQVPTSAVYEPSKQLESRLVAISRCIAIPGVSKIAVGSDCDAAVGYFATKPLHWEGNSWYLSDEWNVRISLVKRGLNLPRDLAPSDHVYYQSGDREMIIVFTGAQSPASVVSSDFSRLLTIGARAQILPPDLIDKLLPVAEARVFGRTKKEKRWIELGRMRAEVMPPKSVVQKFLDPSAEATCPKFSEIDVTKTGVCITEHYDLSWPELTFWTVDPDIQSVPHIYLFAESSYQIAAVGNLFFKKIGADWAVLSGMNRSAYDSDWFHGTAVEALRFEPRSGRLFKDQALTRKAFAFPKVRVGSREGIPSDPGKYCLMKDSMSCIEVTK